MVGLHALDSRLGLPPDAAFRAIEANTLGLLLGMMLLTAALGEAGFFAHASAWVLDRRLSPVGLLYAVTLGAGALSALLLNDAVCLLLAPLVARATKDAGLPRAPYLLALAMGANAGSAMTLAGNPQNMLVAHLSGMSYRDYLVRGGPAGLLALLATAVALHLLLGHRVTKERRVEPVTREVIPSWNQYERWLAVGGVLLVGVGFLMGLSLAWTAMGGAAWTILLRRRDAGPLFERVAWPVLVFFGGLFVLTVALQRTGLPDEALRVTLPFIPSSLAGGLLWLSGVLVAGCQIVSNVPFILLVEPWIHALPDPGLAWTTTAVVSTVAGNLTILGSVANIIVIETAGAEQEIGFWAYLRVGVPVTLAGLAVALGWLILSAPLYG
jgi:Na+/H+ antiporter NhaD/arsenite permease-like protein